MRWGVRKDASSSTASKAKSMSSEQLQNAVKRLELENRYVSLTQSPSEKTKNVVRDIVINEAKQQGRILLSKAITAVVKQALSSN